MTGRIGRIYCVTNRVNGKRYVGQTVQTVDRRWQYHIADACRVLRSALARAIRKYGSEAFTVETLLTCTEPLLDAAEKHFIRELGTFGEDGYNLTSGGKDGRKLATEIVIKMTAARKRFRHTEESRAKLSAKHKGRPKSRQHKDSLSAAQRLRFSNPDARLLRSEEQSRKWQEPEYRQKMRDVHRGKRLVPWTEERRAKVAATWQAKRAEKCR